MYMYERICSRVRAIPSRMLLRTSVKLFTPLFTRIRERNEAKYTSDDLTVNYSSGRSVCFFDIILERITSGVVYFFVNSSASYVDVLFERRINLSTCQTLDDEKEIVKKHLVYNIQDLL